MLLIPSWVLTERVVMEGGKAPPLIPLIKL